MTGIVFTIDRSHNVPGLGNICCLWFLIIPLMVYPTRCLVL